MLLKEFNGNTEFVLSTLDVEEHDESEIYEMQNVDDIKDTTLEENELETMP